MEKPKPEPAPPSANYHSTDAMLMRAVHSYAAWLDVCQDRILLPATREKFLAESCAEFERDRKRLIESDPRSNVPADAAALVATARGVFDRCDPNKRAVMLLPDLADALEAHAGRAQVLHAALGDAVGLFVGLHRALKADGRMIVDGQDDAARVLARCAALLGIDTNQPSEPEKP